MTTSAPPEPGELRSRLLDAGNAIFSEIGYAGATVDDFLVRASTSRATFYRYFRNKEDLFNELTRACFRDMREIVDSLGRARGSETEPEALEDVLRRYRELHQRHAGVFRAWWERAARLDPKVAAEEGHVFNRLVESLTELVADAGIESRIAPEVQAAMLYLLVEGSYSAVTSRWSRIDPDSLAPTLATMIHRAYLGGGVPRRSRRLWLT